MSPDEIFAAHMWPWPDPLLKRDGTGRIIFVNAAFLQMYGGRVEDWRGNSVGGWPVPHNTGHPNRFETRVAGADGELIYDWMEYILADGCGLAIARNVTDLLTPDTPPPGDIMAPQHAADHAQAPSASQQNAAAQAPLAAQMETQAPTQDTNPDPAPTAQGDWDTDVDYRAAAQKTQYQPTEPASDDRPAEVMQYENTALEMHSEEAHVPSHDTHDAEPVSQQDSQAETAEAIAQNWEQQAHAHAASDPNLHDPMADTPSPAVETPANPPALTPTRDQAPTRDHERRALPIENGDSVLGNNWRDAVIAKAVGNAMPPKDDERTQEPTQTASETQSHAAPAAPSGEKKSTSELRILLAEDNAINALLTRTLLEAEGCSVDVVEDGALAVEAVQNAQYDLIFMDMRMPNMDGLESTRKIRALTNVPSNMPIVALTANAFDDDRNACFDSGMNDFMTKPVSAEELSQMVETWALGNPEQRMAS